MESESTPTTRNTDSRRVRRDQSWLNWRLLRAAAALAIFVLLIGVVNGPLATPAADPVPAPTSEGGRVEVTESSVEFGPVKQGTKLRHDFQVVNSGSQDLHLEIGGTSCACTVSLGSSALVVSPGASVLIPVTVDTKNFRERFESTVSIKTNDVRTPHLALGITGRAEPAFRHPVAVTLVPVGPSMFETDVLVQSDTSAVLTSWRVTDSRLSLRSEARVHSPPGLWRFRVSHAGSIQGGGLLGALALTTSSPLIPVIMIPVFSPDWE